MRAPSSRPLDRDRPPISLLWFYRKDPTASSGAQAGCPENSMQYSATWTRGPHGKEFGRGPHRPREVHNHLTGLDYRLIRYNHCSLSLVQQLLQCVLTRAISATILNTNLAHTAERSSRCQEVLTGHSLREAARRLEALLLVDRLDVRGKAQRVRPCVVSRLCPCRVWVTVCGSFYSCST